jgi:hypothetical protein
MLVFDGETWNGNIQIGNSNECCVCGKEFIYKQKIIKDGDLQKVNLITSHKECRKVINKIEYYKKKLLDEEFTLFCLKFRD